MFEPKLMANAHKSSAAAPFGGAGAASGGAGATDGEDVIQSFAAHREELDTEVYVRVEWKDGSQPQAMWHYDKFMNR